VPPTRGAAYLFGIDVRQPIARQRIGYLPEMTYYYKFSQCRGVAPVLCAHFLACRGLKQTSALTNCSSR